MKIGGLISVWLLALGAGAQAFALDDAEMLDAEACRTLVEQREILPMEAIVAGNAQLKRGKILDAGLVKQSPELIYKFEVLGRDGVVREVLVDARDGQTLKETTDEKSHEDTVGRR